MPFDREKSKRTLANLAATGVYVGTSSWKYEGWFGQLYTPGRYEYRGKVAKAKEAASEIEIFTPEEMGKLLTAAQLNPDDLPPGFNKRYAGAGLLPFPLFGGFAGLRTAEIERQRWEDIDLERGFIRVSAGKGGTAQKRLVPIAANLKAWLVPLHRNSGPVLNIARVADAVARLVERAGVEWKHNALRHSFISYRVADTQNVAQVSLEAGNSPFTAQKLKPMVCAVQPAALATT